MTQDIKVGDRFLVRTPFQYVMEVCTSKEMERVKRIKGELNYGQIIEVTDSNTNEHLTCFKTTVVYPPGDNLDRLHLLKAEHLHSHFYKIEIPEFKKEEDEDEEEESDDGAVTFRSFLNHFSRALRHDQLDIPDEFKSVLNAVTQETLESINNKERKRNTADKTADKTADQTTDKTTDKTTEPKKGDLYKLVEQANTPFTIGTIWRVDRASGEIMLLKLEDLNKSIFYYVNKDGLYEFGDFRLKFEKVR